jgi:peptidoglycan/LPS O-acetylase OafA/YrhL/O-antigen ligase
MRGGWEHGLTTVVLGVLWALWPLVALAGGLGFSFFTGLAALVLLPTTARFLQPRLYIAALFGFFVFVGISVLWSPREQVLVDFDFGAMKFAVRSEMLRVGLQVVALGALIGAAMRLGERGRRIVQRMAHVAIFAQLIILVVLTLFEIQILELLRPIVPDTGEGVQNISRNSLILSAAAPVLAIGLMQGRSIGVGAGLTSIVLLATVAILAVRGVNAGLLALAFSGLCVLVVRLLPRHGFRIIAALFAIGVMTAPFSFGMLTQGADFATADDSSSYRLAIWQRVLQVINENPVTGSGLGVLRTIRETIESGVFAGQFTVPNHPHNMILQLWAETGAIGAGLLSLAIILAGWRMPDAVKLGPAGLKAAALVGGVIAVAIVSFDLWNDWWWAVGGLLAVLVVATPAAVAEPVAKAAEGLTFGTEANPALPASATAEEPASGTYAPTQPAPARTDNNFNLLRLAFALMVVVYHAIALPGLAGTAQLESWTGLLAEIGVQGFFILSGYLVWASLERTPSFLLYAEKRARRLLPGYVAVILVTVAAALALVPAVRENIGATLRYFGWNLAFLNFMEPGLPGVFETNRFTEMNGALWTLKIEVMFYLALPLLAFLLRAAGQHRWIMLVAIYVAAEAWRFVLAPAGGFWAELSRQLPGQMSFFITGIALCAWREELNWRSILAPFGILLLVLSIVLPQAAPLRAAGLGIVAVWVAVGIPRLFNAARFGDLSYGLYIAHFPIIQCVVAAGLFATSPGLAIAITAGACLAASLLLWWLIERPALRRDSGYRTA